jgi:hypothetical protein
MNGNRLEILEYNYWEHYKHAKDLSFVLPITDKKRVDLEIELNKMLIEINELKNNNRL